MKNLLNLETSLYNIDTSWEKTKLLLNWLKMFWMVVNFQKFFLKSIIFYPLKSKTYKWLLSLEEQDRGKESCLSSNGQAKLLLRTQKLYQIIYIFCNPLSSVFIQPFWYQLIGTKRNPWVAVYLQSPINYSNGTYTLPLTCTYVTSLLAYRRGELRIKRCIYRVKVSSF